MTYMNHQRGRHYQAWEREAIGRFLHCAASRAEGRRCNVGAAEVIHNTAYRDVCGRDSALANHQSACVMTWVSHFGYDRKEGWRARVRENEGRHCRHGIRKARTIDDFVV